MHGEWVCNDTGAAANDLHIVLQYPAVNPGPITINAPGCPEPTYTYFGASSPEYLNVAAVWSSPCVDPGERVHVSLVAGCTTPTPGCTIPRIACFYWTLDNVLVPSASPAVNPFMCSAAVPTPSPIAIGGSVDVLSPGDESGASMAAWAFVFLALAALGGGALIGYRKVSQ